MISKRFTEVSKNIMTFILLSFALLLLVVSAFDRSSSSLDANKKSDYVVEHSLANNKWSVRGRLIIDFSSKSGSLSIHEWTAEEISDWEQLLKDSRSGYYTLRILTGDEMKGNVSLDSYSMTSSISSSVRACQLMFAEERIVLHSDSHQNIIGFDYETSNPACISNKNRNRRRKRKKKKRDENENEISEDLLPRCLQKSTSISISMGDKGDTPYMPDYEVTPPKTEEKSFWSKYWWMILIGGFLLLQTLAAGVGS